MSKIALGFRHPPTSLEERLTESCSVQFDACLILPKTPRIHCKLKNSPRILQVIFLKGKSGRMQAPFKGRARSLELLTIWDFWCACKRSPKASGYTVKSFAGRKRNAKLWFNFAAKTTNTKRFKKKLGIFKRLLVSFRCLTHNTYSLCASMSLLANSKGISKKTGSYSVPEVPGSTPNIIFALSLWGLHWILNKPHLFKKMT